MISYAYHTDANKNFKISVMNLVEDHDLRVICDIGGGANPVFDLDYIRYKKIKYTLLDISQEELTKAPNEYSKILADIADTNFPYQDQYDLVFSKYVAEHICDAKQFHLNVYKMLKGGGLAFHHFPTLFAPPFIVNKILPEKATESMKYLSKRRKIKFPAYYHWCLGPVKRQIERFEELGFEILLYKGYFGHNYYKRFPPLDYVSRLITNYLLDHPNPNFTSYASLLLRKPN